MKQKLRTLFVLFIIGGILGPVGDMAHVKTNTLSYPPEAYGFYFFDLTPYWVPLLFGFAAVAIGLGHLSFIKKEASASFASTLLVLLIFISSYGVSGILPWPHVILGGTTLFCWWRWDRTLSGALFAFMCAVIGMSVEMVLISKNVFSYNPRVIDFMTIPSWLGWLYALASISLGPFTRCLISFHPNLKS